MKVVHREAGERVSMWREFVLGEGVIMWRGGHVGWGDREVMLGEGGAVHREAGGVPNQHACP